MNSSLTALKFHDGLLIDDHNADRLLGLGDQFIENWGTDAREGGDADEVELVSQREQEWKTIRPLFEAAPQLLTACIDSLRNGFTAQQRASVREAIESAGGGHLLLGIDPSPAADPVQRDVMLPGSRQIVDPLTLAYVAIGANRAITEAPGGVLPQELAERSAGRAGFMDTVVEEAWVLDAIFRGREAEDAGILSSFYDEIAEPFGARYAAAMIADPHATIESLLIAEQVFREQDEAYGTPPPVSTYADLLTAGQEIEADLDFVEEEHSRIEEALPAGEGDYSDGFRAALQSITLALAHAGVSEASLRDAVTTALDTHADILVESPKPR